MPNQNHLEDIADAISSLLLAAPRQKLRLEQLEARLSPVAQTHLLEALDLLAHEGSVEALDNTYYTIVRG